MRHMTAKEFQRNIGSAQKMALKEPLAVTHHGRDHLVLLSADEYRRLTALSKANTGKNRTNRTEVIERLVRFAPHLRRKGVASLSLYGSVARGDDKPESDVDVMVRLAPGKTFSLLDLVGLQNELADELGRTVDVAMEDGLDPHVRDSVAADRIDIF